MADYYTKFSVAFDLPNEAAQQYALQLAGLAERTRSEDGEFEPLPGDLEECVENWSFGTCAQRFEGKHGLWLNSDEAGVDAACAFIRHLLEKFDPKGRVTFEWSHDCSKPRTDAYGGGAAIVTAHEIKTMSTSQWLDEHAA